jgi:hypothetical protein
MFDKSNRYMTKGINYEIPLELQLFMWNCIDELKEQGKELDYLEVFNIKQISKNDKVNIIITHSQEVPEYEKKYMIYADKPIDAKVFVIDDRTHSTMLLADEY